MTSERPAPGRCSLGLQVEVGHTTRPCMNSSLCTFVLMSVCFRWRFLAPVFRAVFTRALRRSRLLSPSSLLWLRRRQGICHKFFFLPSPKLQVLSLYSHAPARATASGARDRAPHCARPTPRALVCVSFYAGASGPYITISAPSDFERLCLGVTHEWPEAGL